MKIVTPKQLRVLVCKDKEMEVI